MVTSLFKWLTLFVLLMKAGHGFCGQGKEDFYSDELHPFYVSVTELNYNQKENILEVSCKMFADDFENTLKAQFKTSIDITHPKDVKQVEKLVNDYLQKHLQVKIDGKQVALQYLGYEKESESVWCYLQVNNVTSIKKLEITNNLLYELFNTQIGIIHAKVGTNRKSTRLNYPDAYAVFEW